MVRLRRFGFGLFAMLGLAASADAGTPSKYQPAVLADSPAIYYKMNETGGATVANAGSAGTSANGLYNGVTVGLNHVAPFTYDLLRYGTYGGASSYVEMPTGIGAMNVGLGDFTLELWYRADGNSRGDLFSNGSDASYTFTLTSNYETPGTLWVYDHTTSGELLKSVSAADNAWHYVVLTRTGGSYDLYVDTIKTALGFKTPSGPIDEAGTVTDFKSAYYDGPKRIGANLLAGGAFFRGGIDEFAFYSAALPQERINEHYVKGGGALPTPEPGALVLLAVGMAGLLAYVWRKRR
jgi:hypothetical protein